MITFLSILTVILFAVVLAINLNDMYAQVDELELKLYDKNKPSLLPVPTAEQWNPKDVIALRGFQGTETGRKFFALSGQKIFTDSLTAFNDVMHTAHSAGKIAGADALLRWQHNLASDVVLKQISQATGVQVATTGLGKSEPRPATMRSF